MGIHGKNPKLRSLWKHPGSGCEQGCHTVKCLGSNLEKQKLFLKSLKNSEKQNWFLSSRRPHPLGPLTPVPGNLSHFPQELFWFPLGPGGHFSFPWNVLPHPLGLAPSPFSFQFSPAVPSEDCGPISVLSAFPGLTSIRALRTGFAIIRLLGCFLPPIVRFLKAGTIPMYNLFFPKPTAVSGIS